MKKLFGLMLYTVCMTSLHAQFSFGMHGGALYCSATAKGISGNSVNQDPGWGAKLGFAGRFTIGKRVALIPQTSLVMRENTLTSSTYIQGGSYSEHLRLSMYMVENNIHVAYVGSRPSGFIAAIGPGISIGVGDNTESTVTENYGGGNVSDTKQTASGYPNFKEVELNVSGYIGYRFSQHFLVKISFLNGFSDIGKSGTSFRGNYIGAGLGVFFGRKGSASPKYNNSNKKEKDI